MQWQELEEKTTALFDCIRDGKPTAQAMENLLQAVHVMVDSLTAGGLSVDSAKSDIGARVLIWRDRYEKETGGRIDSSILEL